MFFGSDVSKDGSKAKWNEEKYTSYTKEEYKQSWGRYIEDAFVYKYKIERIKAYDNIVRNNSSQSKFFLGWVRRVLED